MRSVPVVMVYRAYPHAQGMLQHQSDLGGHHRPIPARAGFLPEASLREGGGPEHPRTGGACRNRGLPVLTAFGTPPPVRGLREDLPFQGRSVRNTPARAGHAGTGCQGPGRVSEHPRSCGACETPALGRSTQDGSPTPVQGLLYGNISTTPVLRNTSARAGPAVRGDGQKAGVEEHPRPCGACDLTRLPLPDIIGTPPHGRGLRLWALSLSCGFRDTPARAGPSGAAASATGRNREHPRPCGACGNGFSRSKRG